MKKVAGKIRIALAQYRELAAFAQFGSELDPTTQKQLDRGRRMTEILKQGQYDPMSVPQQVAVLYAAANGYLDDVDPEQIGAWEHDFHQFLEHQASDWIQGVADGELTEKLEKQLQQLIKEFQKGR